MRRLALLLAASLLGTGCIVSDSTPVAPPCYASTITVRWPSFLLANGGVTPSCATAGITSVDVYLNDQVVQQGIPCGNGGLTITSPPAGSSRITVEGVDARGTILLRDEPVVASAACGDVIVDAQPAEGTLELNYSFLSQNVCTAGGSFIWFSVFDPIANAVTAVADETANTNAYTCSTTASYPVPVPITFALPAGAYTLQRIEEVVPTGGIPPYAATAKNCSPTSFSVSGGVQSVVNVALADSTTLCR